ncbi:hypothetical protein EGT07_11960 [Herbaspirillum sp. HC18]|nr:hypothetical protein EGT07_11960 [Herbaspirillum sp. HC18]
MQRIAVKGTHFETGEALGRLGKPAAGLIEAMLEQDASSASMDRTTADLLMERIQREFPNYWDELRGISTGMGMDVLKVFLWNCLPDFATAVDTASGTIAINRLGCGLVLHNLRPAPALARHCKLVDVHSHGTPGFFSLNLPGRLPGATFAANKAGVVQVTDHIVGEKPGTGLPSFVIGRAVLDARSLPEAIDIVMDADRFGSAHYILASAGEFVMVGIAATPTDRLLTPIPNKYWHTNHLLKSTASESSRAKQSSCERYLAIGKLLARLPSHPTEHDVFALLESPSQANHEEACAASGSFPVQGEIGAALIGIRPKCIDVRMFLPDRAGKRRYVVATG